jgi:hypothetical protein
MKATIAVKLEDAGTDVTFEFDLSDASDAGRFKALGTLLAKHGAAAGSRERFFPLIIDNLDTITFGTRVTMAGDAISASKPIISPQPARAGFKNALDVAIERGNARKASVQGPAQPASRAPRRALDLSEIMDSTQMPNTNGETASPGRKKNSPAP